MSAPPAGTTAAVVGAAGFIGSTLVDRLLADGWRVTGIDCFEPFYERGAKERHLVSAQANESFVLHEVDTRDGLAIVRILEASQPAVVIDLAARAGVRPSLMDPQLYIDINVRGLQNTLAATAAVGARYVFASSSSVYGADPRRPFQEDQLACRPESPYAATKIAGEALVQAHHAVTGLPIAIARLFTVFGPRQRPDLAIHGFARRMLRGKPIELFAGGEAERDYTFVDDVVEALMLLAQTPEARVTVNIGSHRPIRTTVMVDALERSLGVSAIRIIKPAQPGDVPATYADITRAKAILGWEPRWSFEDGIDAFCAWFREVEENR